MLDFTPGGHVLTITFTDVNGNEGSSQYNFAGQTRQGEWKNHVYTVSALTKVASENSCVYKLGQ